MPFVCESDMSEMKVRMFRCMQCMHALKKLECGEVFIHTAQIVKHSFNITLSVSRGRVAFQVRWREWTGLPF